MNQDVPRTLDVREIDGEPFGDIMAALDDLDDEEALRLVSDFEPKPLYEVVTERGFEYDAEQVSPDEWHVTISHD